MLLHVSSVFTFTIYFTWRILLCTKKFLIRLDLLRINGISRIPRFMHTVPVLLIFLNHTAKDIAALTNDDISLTNKTIHIRDGKSRSDRYTLLADRTLEILTEYWFQCGRSRGILFPSSWTGDYLTKDSVIQFFRESAKRAGIQQHVSTHCFFLRREYGITPQR